MTTGGIPTTQPAGIEGDSLAAGGGLTPVAANLPTGWHIDQQTGQPSPPEPEGHDFFGGLGSLVAGDLGEAMLRESGVADMMRLATRPAFAPDPTYNPMNDPQFKGTGYEQLYSDRFVGSRSAEETSDIIGRINREEGDSALLARNGFPGFVAGLGEGFLSPFSLIPVGGEIKAVASAGRAASIVARAGRTALMSGIAVAGQAGVSGLSRETYTPGEAAFSIGAGTLIGGVLGAAVASLSRGHIEALGENIAAIPGSNEEAAAIFKAENAGVGAELTSAAAGEGIPKGTFGVGQAVKFQDPLTRTMYSMFREARLANRQLNEIPTMLEDNAAGIPTSPGGSAEYLAHEFDYALASSMDDLDAAYSKYFFGNADTRFARTRAGIASLTGRDDGKLSFTDFKEKVHEAMHSGDVSDVPEAAEAARSIRSKVEEPLKDEAIKVGLFPEDVKPGDDVSHVFRLWNTEAVARDRERLTGILAQDFGERQSALKGALDQLEREGKPIDPQARQFADMSPAEVRSAAEESVNTILGFSPERMMLPRDIMPGPRGPLKERLLRIPTAKVRDFVVRDIAAVQRAAVRTMGTDIALMKKFGSLDLSSEVAKINDEAARMIAANPAQSAKITRAQKTAIGDLQAMVQRMRGLYGIPRNPDGLLHRAVKVTLAMNFLSRLGNVTITKVMDIGKPIMNYGLNRVFGTAFQPLGRGLSTLKLSMGEARLANAALDMSNHARQMALNEIMDSYGRGSRFERGVQWLTDRFGHMSLLDPWNQFFKEFTGTLAQTRILQSIEKVVGGKATAKEIEYLASNSIDANMAERIWKQFAGGAVVTPKAEKIAQAAVRYRDQVFAGPNHVVAMDEMTKALGWTPISVNGTEDGFVTSNGRFVDRAEANKIAAEADQLKANRAERMRPELMRAEDLQPDQQLAGEGGKGVKDGQVWWANTQAWNDPQAVRAMRAALHREINRTIVTTGQDKPLWMSTDLGRLLGQFKAFNIASMQRTVLAGLQQRDAAALNGAVFMLGLGFLSYYLKETVAGRKLSDNPADWAINAFTWSGLASWVMDANDISTKMSGGSLDVARLFGAGQPAKYASSPDPLSALGPTASDIKSIANIMSAIGHTIAPNSRWTSEWSQSTTHLLRQMIPLQNLFYLRWLFDAAERGVNNAFGIRKRKPS